MATLGWVLRRLALTAVLIASIACNKQKNKSEDAEFSVLPEKPIVIIGPTRDSLGASVEGPWFSFRLHLNNRTGETITIVALAIYVYAQDDSGGVDKKEVSFSPSGFNISSDVLVCSYASFGTFSAGDNSNITLVTTNSSCPTTPVFYIGSNKKGVSGRNYRYRVVVKPLGWFGTYNNPTDRFETQFTFYTQ